MVEPDDMLVNRFSVIAQHHSRDQNCGPRDKQHSQKDTG